MRENDRSHVSPLEDLYAANRVSAQQFNDIWNKLPSAPILKHVTQVPNEPQQGMFVVDPEISAFCFYLGTEWICIDGLKTYACKVYTDRQTNKVEDGAFRLGVDLSMAGRYVFGVAAFNGVEGTSTTTIQLSNQTRGVDILSTPLNIPSGQFMNATLGVDTSGPVDLPNNRLALFDKVWIDVDAVGTGSKGLGVYIITKTSNG